MKTTAVNTNKKLLAGNNEAWLKALEEEGTGLGDVIGILTVIAQVLDFIAKGEDFYLLVGATRNRDAFTLNWKGEGAPGAVYATDLAGLSEQAQELL